jgi:hypothetical protein
MMNEMLTGLPLLKRLSQTVNKTPATFLDMYMPLRLDSLDTAYYMHNSMQRSKPDPTSYYFGIVIAEKTVVQVFKSSSNVNVRPAGK